MSATEQTNSLNFHIKVLYLLTVCSLCGVAINLYFTYEMPFSSPSCLETKLEAPIDDIRRNNMEGDNSQQVTKSHRFKRQTADSAPYVEFYPEPQPTKDTNDYVWLTSVSRVKIPALKEFCIEAKEYCPKGQPGYPGLPGMPGGKGEKGDRGQFGLKGDRGPQGLTGLPGFSGSKGNKGDKGKMGRVGLDGRDGLSGPSGLDGIPGQSGFDGIPGMPGIHGADGIDGIPGAKGEKGSTGPVGPPGTPGTQGMKGDRGRMGIPGHPGITAYKINNTEVHSLLIPPKMVDDDPFSTMTVEEGTKVVMSCKAVGTPAPEYTWRKEGDEGIHYRNRTFLSSSNSETLTIDPVTRYHISNYVCIAGNGLNSAASKKIQLDVLFPPFLKIENQHVLAKKGSTTRLQCEVEANPPGIKYWLIGREKKHIKPNDDHYNASIIVKGYHAIMILEIRNVTDSDYGRHLYQCTCKNEKGVASGTLSLYQYEYSMPGQLQPWQYGEPPPIMPEEMECPKCVACPVLTKCDQSGKYHPLLLRNEEPFNETMKELLGNRTDDCVPEQIGKPVYYREVKAMWGTWLQDPLPHKQEHHDTIWLTTERDNEEMQLLEYRSMTDFEKDIIYRNYKLPYALSGNGHIVYNGSLFYHAKNTNKIVKFDLSTNMSKDFMIKDLAYDGNNHLYNTKHNYVDIEADNHGLWIIYASFLSNNTIIIKINSYTLNVLSKWNITTHREEAGEMFIICGKLYSVKNVTEKKTTIHGIFDLYENYYPGISLEFSNPFRQNYLIGYNARRKHIYTWDRGGILTYPIRFKKI